MLRRDWVVRSFLFLSVSISDEVTDALFESSYSTTRCGFSKLVQSSRRKRSGNAAAIKRYGFLPHVSR